MNTVELLRNIGLSIIINLMVLICYQDALAQINAPVSLTGRFLIIWGDHHSGSSQTRYMLTDDKMQTTILSIDESLVRSLGGVINLNKKYVTIKGELTNINLSQQNLQTIKVKSIFISPRSLEKVKSADDSLLLSGSKPWLSIMCKFSDYDIEPKGLAYFQGMYDNTQPGMDHYWREQSFNNMNVSASNAAGWFTLPHTESYYNPTDMQGETDLDKLASDCIAVADANVNFSKFTGINMMFNTDFDNGYAWGGSRYMTLDGSTKVWSVTWQPPWGYSNVCNIAHEMGHGFGLPHSSGDYGSTYDNIWDVMSDTWTNCSNFSDSTYGCLGQHTISYHKDILGWISAGQKYVADGSNTIIIDHLALSSTVNYRIVQIPIDGSGSHFYTLEVRQREGYDVKLPGKAVVIHKVDTTRSIPAHVVDIDNDGDTGDEGAMLNTGETFTDSAHNISVSVLSATSKGFKVHIVANELPTARSSSIILNSISAIVAANSTKRTVTSCGVGKVYDCARKCVDKSLALSRIGDGSCDDGDCD